MASFFKSIKKAFTRSPSSQLLSPTTSETLRPQLIPATEEFEIRDCDFCEDEMGTQLKISWISIRNSIDLDLSFLRNLNLIYSQICVKCSISNPHIFNTIERNPLYPISTELTFGHPFDLLVRLVSTICETLEVESEFDSSYFHTTFRFNITDPSSNHTQELIIETMKCLSILSLWSNNRITFSLKFGDGFVKIIFGLFTMLTLSIKKIIEDSYPKEGPILSFNCFLLFFVLRFIHHGNPYSLGIPFTFPLNPISLHDLGSSPLSPLEVLEVSPSHDLFCWTHLLLTREFFECHVHNLSIIFETELHIISHFDSPYLALRGLLPIQIQALQNCHSYLQVTMRSQPSRAATRASPQLFALLSRIIECTSHFDQPSDLDGLLCRRLSLVILVCGLLCSAPLDPTAAHSLTSNHYSSIFSWVISRVLVSPPLTLFLLQCEFTLSAPPLPDNSQLLDTKSTILSKYQQFPPCWFPNPPSPELLSLGSPAHEILYAMRASFFTHSSRSDPKALASFLTALTHSVLKTLSKQPSKSFPIFQIHYLSFLSWIRDYFSLEVSYQIFHEINIVKFLLTPCFHSLHSTSSISSLSSLSTHSGTDFVSFTWKFTNSDDPESQALYCAASLSLLLEDSIFSFITSLFESPSDFPIVSLVKVQSLGELIELISPSSNITNRIRFRFFSLAPKLISSSLNVGRLPDTCSSILRSALCFIEKQITSNRSKIGTSPNLEKLGEFFERHFQWPTLAAALDLVVFLTSPSLLQGQLVFYFIESKSNTHQTKTNMNVLVNILKVPKTAVKGIDTLCNLLVCLSIQIPNISISNLEESEVMDLAAEILNNVFYYIRNIQRYSAHSLEGLGLVSQVFAALTRAIRNSLSPTINFQLQNFFSLNDVLSQIIHCLTEMSSLRPHHSNVQRFLPLQLQAVHKGLSLLTSIITDNEPNREHFRKILLSPFGAPEKRNQATRSPTKPLGSDHFAQTILKIENQPSLATLLVFMEMLLESPLQSPPFENGVGLFSDNFDRPLIKAPSVIPVIFTLLPHCHFQTQQFIFMTFHNLIVGRNTLPNLHIISRNQPLLLDLLLDLCPVVHHQALPHYTSLLIFLGKQFTSVSQLKHIFRTLQSKDNCRPSHSETILQCLTGMFSKGSASEVTHSIAFDGRQSGLQLPPIYKWPRNVKALSFSLWIRVESSNPRDSRPGMNPSIFSLRNTHGSGIEFFLRKQESVSTKDQFKLLLQSFSDFDHPLSSCDHLPGLTLSEDTWNFIGFSLQLVEQQAMIVLNGQLLLFPFHLDQLPDEPTPLIGRNYSENNPTIDPTSIFRGETGPIYLFDEALSPTHFMYIKDRGPNNFLSFDEGKEKVESSTIRASSGLFEELNSAMLISFHPLVWNGLYFLDNSPLKGELKWKAPPSISDELFPEEIFDSKTHAFRMHARMLPGTFRLSRQDILRTFESLGGMKTIFPLILQFDQHRLTSTGSVLQDIDPIFTESVLELFCCLLENHSEPSNFVGYFSLIGFFLERIPKRVFTISLFNFLARLFEFLADFPTAQESFLEKIVLNFRIWSNSPPEVQASHLDWMLSLHSLGAKFLSNQLVRKYLILLLFLYRGSEFYSEPPSFPVSVELTTQFSAHFFTFQSGEKKFPLSETEIKNIRIKLFNILSLLVEDGSQDRNSLSLYLIYETSIEHKLEFLEFFSKFSASKLSQVVGAAGESFLPLLASNFTISHFPLRISSFTLLAKFILTFESSFDRSTFLLAATHLFIERQEAATGAEINHLFEVLESLLFEVPLDTFILKHLNPENLSPPPPPLVLRPESLMAVLPSYLALLNNPLCEPHQRNLKLKFLYSLRCEETEQESKPSDWPHLQLQMFLSCSKLQDLGIFSDLMSIDPSTSTDQFIALLGLVGLAPPSDPAYMHMLCQTRVAKFKSLLASLHSLPKLIAQFESYLQLCLASLDSSQRLNEAKWGRIWSEISNDRGPWGSLTQETREVFWKLDLRTNEHSQRLKFLRNEHGTPHRQASLRSSGKDSQAPEPEHSNQSTFKNLTKLLPKFLEDPTLQDDSADPYSEVESGEPTGPDLVSVSFSEEVEIITIATSASGGKTEGTIEINNSKLIFNRKNEHETFDFINNSGNTEFLWACQAYPSSSWFLSEIINIYPKRYLQRKVAIEIFFSSRTSIFINFKQPLIAKSFIEKIKLVRPPHLRPLPSLHSRIPGHLSLTELWRQHKISNFEYLMELNFLAGRSLNDCSQYPVMPWVLKEFTTEKLDLRDPSLFRDLRLPIGAQTERSQRSTAEKYSQLQEMDEFPCHYTTHYSTSAFVIWWLIRIEPFTSYHVWLQDGKFDRPDRLFYSIEAASAGMSNAQDVKELVPEMFYCPEILENMNQLNLGCRADGSLLGPVVLPKWARKSHDFIRLHREALECEYVSQNLHHWIDLIFGYKQRPPTIDGGSQFAIDSYNVYSQFTYQDAIDLEELEELDPQLHSSTLRQIECFGQCPRQLFNRPHPERIGLHELDFIWPIASSIEGVHTIAKDLPRPERPRKMICFEEVPLSFHPIISIVELKGQERLLTVDSNLVVGLHYFRPEREDVTPPYKLVVEPPSSRQSSLHSDKSLSSLFKSSKSIKERKIPSSFASQPLLAPSLSTAYPRVNPDCFSSGRNKENFIEEEKSRIQSSKQKDSFSSSQRARSNSTKTGIKKNPFRVSPLAVHEHLSARLVAVLPNYKALFSCGHWDNTFKVTHIESGRLLQSVIFHRDIVTCIAAAEDQHCSWVCTGSRDCTVVIWGLSRDPDGNLVEVPPIHVLHGHDDGVTCLAVNAKIDIVASGSIDGTVILHSLREGVYLRFLLVGFHPSHLPEKSRTSFQPKCIDTILMNSEGSLVVYCHEGHLLCTYSVNGKLVRMINVGEHICAMCLSEDGKVVITGGERRLVVMRWVFDLSLANTGPRKGLDAVLDGEIDESRIFSSTIRSLCLTKEEKHLIVGLESGEFRILAQNAEYLRKRLHKKLVEIGILPVGQNLKI